MKFSKLSNWGDFRHDGIIYFAQRVYEMLSYSSDAVYKAPVLNTFLLVKEYVDTAYLVKQKTINESHLKYIMEEFQDSFQSDLVIQSRVDTAIQKEILHQLNSASAQQKEKIMTYLLYYLKDYNNWCRELLREIVLQEREKKKIERLVRSYIPGLIGAGYSHEYIYYYNRRVFFEQSVTSTEVLDIFLNRFDFKQKKYDVYVAIDKQAFTFRNILESRLGVIFIEEEFDPDLKYDNDNFGLIKIHLDSLDEKTAAGQAYDRLDLFFKYYRFLGNRKDDWLFNTGKVVDECGSVSIVSLKPEGVHLPKVIEDKTVGRMSEELISSLLINASDAFQTIVRAIDVHNLAIAEKSLKNGFLNLWSTLEILFVTDQSESKINEIQNKILPVLQKDYLCIVFSELLEYFKDNVSKIDFELIKGKVAKCESDDLWFHRLLLLTQYSDVREEVYSLLCDYPLIRSRISQLSDQYFKKESILADVNRYTQRITWHFKRLYRTRNAIIHAGDTPDNLKELCEHLHSYIDCCLLEVLVQLSTQRRLCSIENVIVHVQLKTEMMLQRLKGKKEISESEIDLLF